MRSGGLDPSGAVRGLLLLTPVLARCRISPLLVSAVRAQIQGGMVARGPLPQVPPTPGPLTHAPASQGVART